mgnify:CR=1 FL=1
MRTVNYKTLIATFVLVFAVAFASNAQGQDKKLEKAENKFCNSISEFASSLVTLGETNGDSSMDDFNKAYKNAQKAYNKFEKSAAKLEKVEIKESTKAYNKMVDSINKIDGDNKTADAADEIGDNIDATAASIADIMTVVCQ